MSHFLAKIGLLEKSQCRGQKCERIRSLFVNFVIIGRFLLKASGHTVVRLILAVTRFGDLGYSWSSVCFSFCPNSVNLRAKIGSLFNKVNAEPSVGPFFAKNWATFSGCTAHSLLVKQRLNCKF